MIPYAQHHITPEDEAAVQRVLKSRYLTQGPEVEAFESELSEKTGARFCVAVNSGTAALHLAYLSIELRNAMMSPISFVATANAALMAGATVSFTDTTYYGRVTKGTVGVTLGGNPVSGRYEVVDACHGPLIHRNAHATVLSFHPAKHIACGEGGAVLTDDKLVYERCKVLRDHGRQDSGQPVKEQITAGFNYRMPEMAAALGRSQLQRYDWNVAQRRRLAARYDEALAGKVDVVPHTDDSARHLYSILTDDRDTLRDTLKAQGIGTAIHYRAIHLEPYYRQRFGFKRGDLPYAERYAERTLSLPLFPTLTEQEQDTVIAAVLDVRSTGLLTA